MKHLIKKLNGLFEESSKLEQAIKANMKGLDYGG
jgi:hypothetical protein